jgi:hypothetical protein
MVRLDWSRESLADIGFSAPAVIGGVLIGLAMLATLYFGALAFGVLGD